MNAMTWWDHDTLSIWSQPWGTAIAGPLKGTTLDMIPVSLVPWNGWRAEHPDTLVLTAAVPGFGRIRSMPIDDFVVGVVLEDAAKAYRFTAVAEEGVVNDTIGTYPVVVFADAESRSVHVYLRDTGQRVLTFELVDGSLVDQETGTVWDPARGLALEGPLRGTALRPLPYTSAYGWAWRDFYPGSPIYGDAPDFGLRIFVD